MNYLHGNTVRRNPEYHPEDGILMMESSNFYENTVDLLDNKFSVNVPYSIKKKKRWNMSSVLMETYDTDPESITIETPIRYSKTQYQRYRDKRKVYFLYDSKTNTKIGSDVVTDRKFVGNPKNHNSVLHELNKSGETYVVIDDREIRNRVKEKMSDKYFNSKSSLISYLNKEMKNENDQLKGSAMKGKYFSISENIQVNNSYYLKKGYPCYGPSNSKRSKSNKFEIADDFEDDYSTFEDEVTEDEVTPEEWSVGLFNDLRIPSRPITSIESGLIVQSESVNRKKKRKKRKLRKNVLKQNRISETDSKIEEKENCSDVYEEILPNIIITQRHDSFVDEILTISDFCRCYTSDTRPTSYLIDLDFIEKVKNKNFVIVTPIIEMSCHNIKVKVLFNLDKCDIQTISRKNFHSIRQLIEFLQSSIVQEEDTESSSKVHFLKTDGPDEKTENVLKTSYIDDTKTIFSFNKEWRQFEFRKEQFLEIITKLRKQNRKTKNNFKCEICLNNHQISDLTSFKQCQHRICKKCSSVSLIKQIKDKCLELKCPVNNCPSTADCVTILSLMSFKTYSKRLHILEEQVIKDESCSCQNCGLVLIKEGNFLDGFQRRLRYLCKCGKRNCGQCGSEHDWPILCDEMKSYNNQLIKLDDVKTSNISEVYFVEGRFCPRCGRFSTKSTGNTLQCKCGTKICFACGRNHYFISPKCYNLVEDLPIKVEISLPCNRFEPNSWRSKIYCQSFHIRALSNRPSVSSLKEKLRKIDNKIKNCPNLDTDRETVIAKYFEILKVIESIYVAVNFMDEQRRQSMGQFLKTTAKQLIFYICQVDSAIDELNFQLCVGKSPNCSAAEIVKKRERIEKSLNDAAQYLKRLRGVIH